MRLRTSESYNFLKNGLLYTYPSLQENIEGEIVVIGGGITGALVSHALVEAGHQVILIDKRDIGLGSTAATTSILQYEIDVPLVKLKNIIGEENAAACFREGIRSLQVLENLILQHNIHCEFAYKESLYLSHNKPSAAFLFNEYRLREKYQLEVSWLSQEELETNYGLKSPGAILSKWAAGLDAYQLAHELIHLNAIRGMKVFDQTSIKKFELNRAAPQIVTGNGKKIQCKKIVFCTGYETVDMFRENICQLRYTFASISEADTPIHSNIKNTVVWTTHSPYFYLRCTDDKRLIIGGEDENYAGVPIQQSMVEKKGNALRKKLKSILPQQEFTDDFNWGGVFGATKDGLPYIGESPEYPNAIFVLAFGGNGITFSVQAMEIITRLLQGKNHPLESFYRFGR